MWKHQMLKGLDLLSRRYRSWGVIRNSLEAATVFHLGDVRNTVLGSELQKTLGTRLFKDKLAYDGGLPHSYMLLEYNTGDAHAMLVVGGQTPDKNGLRFMAFPFGKANGDFFPSGLLFDFHARNDEPTANAVHILDGFKEYYTDLTDQHPMVARGMSALSLLNTFLLLISCKNIVTETVQPDAKLQKKRAKKGKLPLYEYKVLRVESIGKKRPGGAVGDSGIKQREHLCRGHFKNFSTDNPLFGKYTGRYWWQSQVRGNKELGTIEKEYSV